MLGRSNALCPHRRRWPCPSSCFTFALVQSLRCSTALQLSCSIIIGRMAARKKAHDNLNCPNLQTDLEILMANLEVCRGVGLEIINNTKTVTLEDFRCASPAPLLLSASLPWGISLKCLGCRENNGGKLSAWCQSSLLQVPPAPAGPLLCMHQLHYSDARALRKPFPIYLWRTPFPYPPCPDDLRPSG